jgi:sterol-4alpha-carboxylate 3-dehydrogenase (decarboxylating)
VSTAAGPRANCAQLLFQGHAIVQELVRRYPQSTVVSLDLVQRHFPEKDQWTFCSADLTDEAALSREIERSRTSVIFHTASPWSESGADICEKVNVQGTTTIVEAALKGGVSKLVYTGSAGAVFDGNDLPNADERMPVPDGPALDPYNITKVRSSLAHSSTQD